MFIVFFLISLINLIYAFEPSCKTCKYFIPNEIDPTTDLGLCKMFQDKVYYDNTDVLFKNLAIHCRNNENLCGKSGFLYEPINSYSEILGKYENMEDLCSSEFIDQKDLEELEKIERDILEIFQKMRKHNTMRIYKTSKDIYKLFKKNKK